MKTSRSFMTQKWYQTRAGIGLRVFQAFMLFSVVSKIFAAFSSSVEEGITAIEIFLLAFAVFAIAAVFLHVALFLIPLRRVRKACPQCHFHAVGLGLESYAQIYEVVGWQVFSPDWHGTLFLSVGDGTFEFRSGGMRDPDPMLSVPFCAVGSVEPVHVVSRVGEGGGLRFVIQGKPFDVRLINDPVFGVKTARKERSVALASQLDELRGAGAGGLFEEAVP